MSQIDPTRFMITTRLIVNEAIRRGYSVSDYASRPSSRSYVIRCEKNYKELYFKSLCTALSPSYAVFIAEDKILTKNVLCESGIKMPDTLIVRIDDPDSIVVSNDVLCMLKRYGRLVVKPIMENHGSGVTVDVRDKNDLVRALQYAYQASGRQSEIIVQQMVFGQEYRFLVLNDKVLAVAYRRPPFVVGDGISTVRQLIEKKNAHPLRGEGHDAALTKIGLSEVQDSNLAGFLDAVPEMHQEVNVLKTSNLSRGGEAVDVTDETSPELKKIAVHAARACSLGIAGVDIMTDNISGDGSNSYVLEVNVSPGIRMHQFPSVGKPRNVANTIFRAIEKTAHPIGKKIITIGRVEKVELVGILKERFRARIDTGATVSSLWASDIRTDETGLYCKLFGEGHPLFTGEEIHFSEYSMRSVRSSSGHEELRYQIVTTVRIKGRKIKAKITLADRSGQLYVMLVGRNILRNKFVVDVANGNIDSRLERLRNIEKDGKA